MKSLFTLFILIFFSAIPAENQIIDEVLALVPGEGSEKLALSGITGYIDYQYSGEISQKRNEASHYSAVFIDSLGRIFKSVEFNRFRQPVKYSCNKFDERGNLAQRVYYGPGGTLSWSEGFFYDVSGRLVERIEYAANGFVDGKILYFYNSDGLLYKTRQLNHAGELSFFQIIYYSAINQPERLSLKQAHGFTMSNTLIRYNDRCLPVERTVSAGLNSSVSREEFFYDQNDLLTEQRSYHERDLTSVNTRSYCHGNFSRMLMENKLYMDEVICPEKCCDPVVAGYVSSASFSRGTDALQAYLNSVVKMPDSATQQGVIMVEFEVKPNGKIRKPGVLKGLSPFLDEMAVDIVRNMPSWIPPQSPDGKPEKSTVYLPVVFMK